MCTFWVQINRAKADCLNWFPGRVRVIVGVGARVVGVLFLMIVLSAGMHAAAETGGPDGIEVLNAGVGGHTSSQGLARFQRDVVAAAPQHLVLYFGMNDAMNSRKLVGLEQFRGNLQAMVDRAREAGVRTVILVTLNPVIPTYLRERHPDHPAADLRRHLARYDAVIREVAEANCTPVVDLRALIADHGGASDAPQSLIRNPANANARDGVHLRADGYRLLAREVADVLADSVHPGDRVVCLGDSLTYGAHMSGAGSARGDTYPAFLHRFLNRGRHPPE